MTSRHPHIGGPRAVHSALEWRGLFELALLPCSLPVLATAPQGDGHPVLLLPGFMGSEGSLIGLELYLRNRGYAVETWGLGRHVGFHAKHATALEQKIRHLHHKTGREVSLVGWSLGGVFAIYGAHEVPESVRNVVTLGSPVSVDPEGSKSPAFVKAMYRVIAHPQGPNAHVMQPRVKKMREMQPPQVPVSCLYSISDGVVPAQEATIAGDDALHENIRVQGSHTGLGFNAMVMLVVADRLAQPEGGWRPFNPAGVSGTLYRLVTHEAVPI